MVCLFVFVHFSFFLCLECTPLVYLHSHINIVPLLGDIMNVIWFKGYNIAKRSYHTYRVLTKQINYSLKVGFFPQTEHPCLFLSYNIFEA